MQCDQQSPNPKITRRIITSSILTPQGSPPGTVIPHAKVIGRYALAKRVMKEDFGGKGLVLDSKEDKEAYRRKMLAADLSLAWRIGTDPLTNNLRLIAAGCYMPRPTAFTFIAAASPFFRVPDIVSDYQGVVEVPWVERTFQSSKPGVKLTYHQSDDLREGSYIQLCDYSLSQRSNWLDTPFLQGQIHEFIGFDNSYVVASIFIIAFYRHPSRSLTSYTTGKIILAEPHRYEETIVLLRRARCRFDSNDLLEYNDGELTGPHYYRLHSQERMIEHGPERLWTHHTSWEHPFQAGTECTGHYRVLEEEERIGRGQLF